MIVYCVPDIDDTSPVGSAYVGTLREAEALAREASKADNWNDEFLPDAGSKKVVVRIKLRKADKAGVLAFLNHEGFAKEHDEIAVFRNGRRVKP